MKKIALLTEKSREYGRELLKGVAAYAQTRGDWQMYAFTPADITRKGVLDGFSGIIARAADAATCRLLLKTGLPIVDAFAQRSNENTVRVDCDHEAIAALAARYFNKHRFQKFAFCGFRGTQFSDDRRDVFKKLITNDENGRRVPHVKFFEYMEHEPPSDDIFFEERVRCAPPTNPLREWVASLPDETAVFCANDYRAYQVLELARELGRPVPEKLSVMGVDDDTILCAFSSPSLSSINPNAFGVGYAAAMILNTMISDPSEKRVRPVFRVGPKGLVERASSHHYPIDPPWMEKLLDRIHGNYAQPPTTMELVATAGVSHPLVETAFRKNFGMTIGKYVMAARMEEAARLMSEGHSSSEVGRLTGFTTPQYFTECYRRHFGHAPTKF